MKIDELEQMSPNERREFLKYVAAFLALPFIPDSTRNAMLELLLGPNAHAQAAPVYFLEVNFRDQWDFQSLFVPPSIARNYENVKARMPPAGAPTAERNNFYLTPNAVELRPHLDSIAVMELGEICVGSVHAHEAANPMRSPGRSYQQTSGKIDMSTVDKRPGGREAGNETYYSSTPTPAVLHNYYHKSLQPNLTNGLILRSSLRTDIHTYYHFEANLANAQPDRFFDRATLLNRFNGSLTTPTQQQTNLQKHGALVARILKRLDYSYLQRVIASEQQAKHGAKADALERSFATVGQTPAINLALSSDEDTYWKTDISPQVYCGGDDANQCQVQPSKWHPSELFAYAGKLFRADQVRSIAIDFDMSDVHTNRTKYMMDVQSAQSGKTLARLITYLKNNNLWDRTVIAMYTLDGSRSPDSNSTGQDAKNAVVLAGGKVKGGYYGDISYGLNNSPTYMRPDDNGNPIAGGTNGGEMRVPGADVYKTVLTAAGVPATLIDSFPDAKPGKVLSYMLK